MDDEKLKYERARSRVHKIRDFYTHLIVYVAVNIMLVGINLIYSPEYLWFIWSVIGWGVGILAHGFSVFGLGGLLGQDWEERKIKEFMERDKD